MKQQAAFARRTSKQQARDAITCRQSGRMVALSGSLAVMHTGIAANLRLAPIQELSGKNGQRGW
jgi:hypothetical protein